jgi:hypothetical protein
MADKHVSWALIIAAFILLLAVIYFVAQGATGYTVIKMDGLEVRSDQTGVIMIVLAVYLLIRLSEDSVYYFREPKLYARLAQFGPFIAVLVALFLFFADPVTRGLIIVSIVLGLGEFVRSLVRGP